MTRFLVFCLLRDSHRDKSIWSLPSLKFGTLGASLQGFLSAGFGPLKALSAFGVRTLVIPDRLFDPISALCSVLSLSITSVVLRCSASFAVLCISVLLEFYVFPNVEVSSDFLFWSRFPV